VSAAIRRAGHSDASLARLAGMQDTRLISGLRARRLDRLPQRKSMLRLLCILGLKAEEIYPTSQV
jgi:hypothetical protein